MADSNKKYTSVLSDGTDEFTIKDSEAVKAVKVGSSGSAITPTNGTVTIPAYEEGADVTDAENVKAALSTNSTHDNKFLRKDGTWQTTPDTHHDGSVAADSGYALTKVQVSSNGTWSKEQVPIPSTSTLQSKITASGILKGNGNGGVTAATEGTDYQAPLSFKTTPSSSNKVVTESDIPTTMVASGSNHAGGLVPDTPSTAGASKYLREDGTWEVVGNKPATTGTTGDYPYNGMGRVILDKNLVNGVPTLTQSMMPTATGGNTIYVIQYDFTLGEDITIPANCVLEFDGGSISGNYKITLSSTFLTGKIKLYTRFDGSVNNQYLLVDDFAISNDITNAFQDIVSITNVQLSGKDYITTEVIHVPSNRYIKGSDGTHIYNSVSNTIYIIGNNVTIEQIHFESESSETFSQYIIFVKPAHNNIYIHNCSFKKATGGIFTEYEVQDMRVSDCIFDNMFFIPEGTGGAGGYGICISHKDEPDDYTWGGRDMVFTNNTFKEGVYRHCFYIQSCENVIIANNIMYGKNQQTYSGYDVAISVRGSKNLTIESNILNNGHALYDCVADRYHGLPSNIIIKGNTINNTQAAVYKDLGAIHVIGKNYLIDGNVFNDTGKYDIRIDEAEGVTISNNVMNKSVSNIGVMILTDSKDTDIVNNVFNGHSVAVKVFGGTMNNISVCRNRMNVQNYAISFEHYSIVQDSKMIIDGNIAYKSLQIVGSTELNKLALLRITNNQFSEMPSLSDLTIAIFVKGNSSPSNLTGGRNFGSSNIRPGYMNQGINEIGFMYFNTTTGMPNFWNGTVWVDATGTPV